MFGFNFAPRGWSVCDGQLLPISQNTALFSLMGTTFGGDGRTTFSLPDLRGRSATHVGNGPGLSPVSWGERGGSTTTTLTTANLPAHSHSVAPKASTGDGDEANPKDGYPANSNPDDSGMDLYAEQATPDVTMGATQTSTVGGNQPVNIQNPYLGIYHCIAMVGVYPSRN